MTGIIVKSTGSSFWVKTAEGEFVECRIKGNFRIKGIKSTNPVAVGDRVRFDVMADGIGWITAIEDRKNYIVRRPANLSKQLHIIAANLDQLLLTITINHPETSTVFIDRVLATSEAYQVPTILVINKIDLYTDDEKEYMKALQYLYETVGYHSICVSAQTGEGIEQLREIMRGKTSLLSGNSGVGKSSLINALSATQVARTGQISDVHNKGMHTTTFSEMYEIEKDSYLIDTPGIKGFGTIDFQKEEVDHYFPEIFKFSADCKYGNCLHIKEPGCAVRQALEDHYISETRYNSYLSILDDCDEGKYR